MSGVACAQNTGQDGAEQQKSNKTVTLPEQAAEGEGKKMGHEGKTYGEPPGSDHRKTVTLPEQAAKGKGKKMGHEGKTYGEPPGEPPGGDAGDGDFDPNQDVKKLSRKHVSNTLDVRFIVAGDPHFCARRYYGKWQLDPEIGHGIGALRYVTNDINHRCDWLDNHDGPECQGVVMLGDMTRGERWNHSMLFFRSLYEHDHTFSTDPFGEDCWDDEMPSNDDKIWFPVFLGIGNHDDMTERSEAKNCVSYIRKRLHDSNVLFQGKDKDGNEIENYNLFEASDIYAWEWGNFHFINMGLWAFYGGYENNSRAKTSYSKRDWFVNHLRGVGKEKAIILFQHFGWDYFSLHDSSTTWWTQKQVDVLADAICDRDPNCSDPFNVIAIFTGHNHEFGYADFCLHKDSNGKCTKSIPNYQVEDAGHDNDNAGYFHVRLNVMDGDTDDQGNLTGEIVVNTIKFCGGADSEDWDGYNTHVTEPWKTKSITTTFLTFDQGEPNNAGEVEHCAMIKSNGRYNDEDERKKHRVLCQKDDGTWGITDTWDYMWKEGFEACREMGNGWNYTTLESTEEQRDIIDLLNSTGSKGAWINYTDKPLQGKWIEAPWFFEFFDDFEPNHGNSNFEKGWGQNCAIITPGNQMMHDQNCEMRLQHFACKNSGDWHIKGAEYPRGGDWADGYHECSRHGMTFEFPKDAEDFESLQEAVIDSGVSDNIWLALTDLDEEGVWSTKRPWIYDRAGWATDHPVNPGDNQNCALMGASGLWFDVRCENYNQNPFACRNYETGEWKHSTSTSRNWIDGFQACRDLGLRYHFATPIREEDNNELKTINNQHETWLNYTDADSDGGDDLEGFWRHGFWKNWKDGEPNDTHGHEDCASMTWPAGDWNDSNCDDSNPALCRYDGPYNAGEWYIMYGHFVTWHDAAGWCSQYGGWKFSYPTCPSEQEAVNELIIGNESVWFQYNDIDSEGYFIPWH